MRDELIHLHQVREALEGMAIELACGKLTDADFASLETLAEAAEDPTAPGYLKASDEFDVTLHGLIAERSGNPLLVREIRKLHEMTLLIHDQLETVLIGGHRVDPEEQRELRSMGWHEHVKIVAALKSKKPDRCLRGHGCPYSVCQPIQGSTDASIGLGPKSERQSRAALR